MAKKQLLSKFGTSLSRSNDEARANCDLWFRRLREFHFTRQRETELRSSGPTRDDWRVAIVRSTGHSVTIEEDSVALLMPYVGRISVRRGQETCVAEPGSCIFVGGGERTTTPSEGYVGSIVQLPATAVRQLASEIQLANAESLTGMMVTVSSRELVTATQVLIDDLDRRGAGWWDRTGPRPGLRSRIGELYCMIGDCVASDRGTGGGTEPSIEQVARAEEYMRARIGDEILISDIAQHVGVSPRALQSAFRRHRGSSPKTILTTLRLAEARRRLLDPDSGDSIAVIAIDLGFGHFGRFSEAYRRAYGERPSESRRNGMRRGRAAAIDARGAGL